MNYMVEYSETATFASICTFRLFIYFFSM